MSNEIKVIAINVNTREVITCTTMNHAPRYSDEIRVDTPFGGASDFYVVKRVVWGTGGLSSYLYLGVAPLPGRLDIGEQPAEDES